MYVAVSGCQFSTLGLHLGTSIVGHKEEPLFYMHFKILNINYIIYNKYMCMYVHNYVQHLVPLACPQGLS